MNSNYYLVLYCIYWLVAYIQCTWLCNIH